MSLFEKSFENPGCIKIIVSARTVTRFPGKEVLKITTLTDDCSVRMGDEKDRFVVTKGTGWEKEYWDGENAIKKISKLKILGVIYQGREMRSEDVTIVPDVHIGLSARMDQEAKEMFRSGSF